MIAYPHKRNIYPFDQKNECSLSMQAYQLDCLSFDNKHALENAIREQWHDKGLVVLVNTKRQPLGDLQQWGSILFQNLATEKADTKAGYLTHSSRCSIIGAIKQPLQQAEVTRIVDNKWITQNILATVLGQKLQEKGICYIRHMEDKTLAGMTTHIAWQDAFFTYSRAEVERYITAQNWDYQWLPNGTLETRYVVDAYKYDERFDHTPYFTAFNSSTTFFGQWHPFNTLPNEAYPLNITLGDGTPFTKSEIKQLYTTYHLASFPLPWQQADIVLLDNLRWAYESPNVTLQGNVIITNITMGMMGEQEVAVFS